MFVEKDNLSVQYITLDVIVVPQGNTVGTKNVLKNVVIFFKSTSCLHK